MSAFGDDTHLPEVRNGWLEPGHARRAAMASLDDPLDRRFADAASPGLTFPFLRGDEAIELLSMTPDGRMVVRIPREPPVVGPLRRGPIRVDDTMASFLEDVEVRVDGERIAPIGTRLQP